MTYVAAPQHDTAPARALDPVALVLGDALREAIFMGSVTNPRSLQVSAGASEIGGECPRQQSYRAHRVSAVNFPDVLPPLIGTGIHLVLARIFDRLDQGSGAYATELPVLYRGIPGTLDLYLRRRHAVVDFKSTTKRKIAQLQREGPPRAYVVQLNIYAAALMEAGETIRTVALFYLPKDGTLEDCWVWSQAPDKALADDAISAWKANAEKAPADATPVPTRLCGWCSHYRPGSTDLAVACPGDATLMEGEADG